MIILDTNVISEIMKPIANSNVLQWLEKQSYSNLFTTVITKAELLSGAYLLDDGKRKNQIIKIITDIFAVDFEGRMFDFNDVYVGYYADIIAHRKTIGKPISQFDAMIAAIAKCNGAIIATRNIKDFKHLKLKLIDPWNP